MRLGDYVFFAPGIKYKDLDFRDDVAIVYAFQQRVGGFYLEPARKLTNDGFWFASGLCCVSTIDLLARYQFEIQEVGKRIKKWFHTSIPGANEKLGIRFSDEFRNGLVHEGRIKNGGQFVGDDISLEFDVYEILDDCLIIKPAILVDCIKENLDLYCDSLLNNQEDRSSFLNRLEIDFKKEIKIFGGK